MISDDLGGGQLFSWSSAGNPQMLADLQDWLVHPSTNFGWALLGDETKGQTAKRLNSGESVTLPNIPPSLEVEYQVVPEPSAMLLALGGCGVLLVAALGKPRSTT